MTKNRPRTGDARDQIADLAGNTDAFWEGVEKVRRDLQIAQLVYDARKAAGLTQQQLADRIGSTQPNIARLEDADYEGHSLEILIRIGAALGLRLELGWSEERAPAAE